MAPKTQKKRLLALADQLKSGKGLTSEQTDYLAACFEAMGHGEDGNSVFGLSYNQGRSESDEKRRENLRLIFWWIVNAMDSEYGHGYTLKQALDEVAQLTQIKGVPFKPMDRASIESAWYKKKYRYLKQAVLRSTDLHSPIGYRAPPET